MPQKQSISNDDDLYVGISGCELAFDKLDLGEGIHISKTYAHLMAPHLMAFSPAPQGGHHPGPWKVVSGGRGFDITAEIHLPAGCKAFKPRDRRNFIRMLAALLRLSTTPTITVSVFCNTSFNGAADVPDDQVCLIANETAPRGLPIESPEGRKLTIDRLEWVRENWRSCLSLTRQHKEFRIALQAIDDTHFVLDEGLALVSTWAALEGLFASPAAELRFRASALIASFLEPYGSSRRALHKKLTDLYKKRSKAAHGGGGIDSKILVESMNFLRLVLLKMIQEVRLPSRDELEERLFGGGE